MVPGRELSHFYFSIKSLRSCFKAIHAPLAPANSGQACCKALDYVIVA